MGSLIHELDNDALLMMYLADELSAEDRADVEQLLGVDAGLRAGLVAVRADGESASRALDLADRFDPPAGVSASGEAVAVRWAGRVFRQFQVDLLARNRKAPVPERQLAFPRWAYPIGSVAAVLLVAVGWWGWERRTAGHDGANLQAQGTGGFGGGNRPVMFVGDASGYGPGSTPDLAYAEREADALRKSVDPTVMPGFLSDGAAD